MKNYNDLELYMYMNKERSEFTDGTSNFKFIGMLM